MADAGDLARTQIFTLPANPARIEHPRMFAIHAAAVNGELRGGTLPQNAAGAQRHGIQSARSPGDRRRPYSRHPRVAPGRPRSPAAVSLWQQLAEKPECCSEKRATYLGNALLAVRRVLQLLVLSCVFTFVHWRV
jgi:hypothetical protein